MTPEEIKSKINTVTVHQLDYNDFEQIVKSTYNQYFCFVSSQECGNDSQRSFGPFKRGDEIQSWDAANFGKFKSEGYATYSTAPCLLQDLINKNLLPEGEYSIEVCW